MATFLHTELKAIMYSGSEIKEGHSRMLLNLRSQTLTVKELEIITASGMLNFRPWEETVSFFEPTLRLRRYSTELRFNAELSMR